MQHGVRFRMLVCQPFALYSNQSLCCKIPPHSHLPMMLVGEDSSPAMACEVWFSPCSPSWFQVFHAPHIAGLSSTFGTRFQPIRYILNQGRIASNVGYDSAIVGEGWLSAAGEHSWVAPPPPRRPGIPCLQASHGSVAERVIASKDETRIGGLSLQ